MNWDSNILVGQEASPSRHSPDPNPNLVPGKTCRETIAAIGYNELVTTRGNELTNMKGAELQLLSFKKLVAPLAGDDQFFTFLTARDELQCIVELDLSPRLWTTKLDNTAISLGF